MNTQYQHKQTDIAEINALLNKVPVTATYLQTVLQMEANNYIQRLFGWSDALFERARYGCMFNYCLHYTCGNPYEMDKMLDCIQFTAWFHNLWANTNIFFMEDQQFAPAANIYNAYGEWLTRQNSQLHVRNHRPPRTVLEAIRKGGGK